jgi:hypothetical protein
VCVLLVWSGLVWCVAVLLCSGCHGDGHGEPVELQEQVRIDSVTRGGAGWHHMTWAHTGKAWFDVPPLCDGIVNPAAPLAGLTWLT